MSEITSWHNYPSIHAFGSAPISELLLDDVLIEEKLDGSQFSFGIFGGELKVRSKGVQMYVDAPEQMFKFAVDYVKQIKHLLRDGYTYRAEYLAKPKHNTLAYDRIPVNYLMVFDINPSQEAYLSYEEKEILANDIGLEVIPKLYYGRLDNPEKLRELLKTKSCLGGVEIEGVVVKNYNRFGKDKKALMGKFVSERFKEVHKSEWSLSNPTSGDIIEGLVKKYRSPARWLKCLQHLRDSGKLEVNPRDIPLLLNEFKSDLEKECEEEIKQDLYNWAKNKILRGATGGLPEWYKERLLEMQFEEKGHGTNNGN